jgi:hypothetical protein
MIDLRFRGNSLNFALKKYFVIFNRYWTSRIDWVIFTPFLQVYLFAPFYLTAIYAFVKQREWIRHWGLLWTGCLLTSYAPTFIETYFGDITLKHPYAYSVVHAIPPIVRSLL